MHNVTDLVIGLGRVGWALHDALATSRDVVGMDLEPAGCETADVVHICYEYSCELARPTFVQSVADYVRRYEPRLCIVHSAVVPGTTSLVAELAPGCLLAYSPVRRQHGSVREDLLQYHKFVAGVTAEATREALVHLADAGFTVYQSSSCEALELAKRIEAGLRVEFEVER